MVASLISSSVTLFLPALLASSLAVVPICLVRSSIISLALAMLSGVYFPGPPSLRSSFIEFRLIVGFICLCP